MAKLAEKKSAGGKKARDNDAPPRRQGYHAYKPGEGYATRLGTMATGAAFVLYTCYNWFYGWKLLRSFFSHILPGFMVDWTDYVEIWIKWGGTVLLAALGGWVVYYYVYVHPRTSEFLVKTDSELGKVTWPKAVPWFKPETQVWSATYVVLITVVFLTFYIFGIDFVFQALARLVFYSG